MKLVEILARELVRWPEGASLVVQDCDGEVKYQFSNEEPEIQRTGVWIRDAGDEPNDGIMFHAIASTDQDSAIVTRAMWEEERERTARMDIITESLCGQEQYRTPCTVIGEYEGRMVIVEDGENKPRFIDRDRLHPHMTAEQWAAKEREDAVDAMWSAAQGKASSAALELLYDAGYRRL